MAAIVVRDFIGRIPELDPKELPDRAAQIATDIDLSEGVLHGLRGLLAVTTTPRTGQIKSLYRFGRDNASDTNYWFTSNNDVDWARNPAAGDAQERTYFTGNDAPKVTDATVALTSTPYPAASYRLGLPAPAVPELTLLNNALTAASYLGGVVTLTTQYKHSLVPGTKVVLSGFTPTEYNATVTITAVEEKAFSFAAPTGATAAPTALGTWASFGAVGETRAYVYAWLSAWDELGPPSDPVVVVLLPHQVVQLSAMETSPAGTGPFNVNRKRIYRTIPGQQQTSYFRVAEISSNASTRVDDTGYQQALADVLPSSAWIALPDSAAGLKLMNNGIGVAFADNTVHVSEAYRLHAFPQAYQKSTDFKIVGVGAFGSFAGVLTQGYPYLLSGSSPRSMSMIPAKGGPACVSKRSIAEDDAGVFYAGPDGLAYLDRSGARYVTGGVMTIEQWRALVPSSIHGVVHQGVYLGFYDTGSVQGGFVFVPGQQPVIVDLSDWFEAVHLDRSRGNLYGVRAQQIYRLEGDANNRKTFTWRSKQFETPQLTNFAFGRVACAGSVTMKVYADGVLRTTKLVTDPTPFRLAAGFKARVWEIELTGTGRVIAAGIAHSPAELEGVTP